MKIEVLRYSDDNGGTLGLLKLNGKFFCYTVEDTFREVKIKNETRIPEGEYTLGLRDVGGMTGRYAKKFPAIHKGMLHIQGIPNFKYVYFHIGNDIDDTSGCILTTDTVNNNTIGEAFGGSSTKAYVRLYKEVMKALDRDEVVTIEIKTI